MISPNTRQLNQFLLSSLYVFLIFSFLGNASKAQNGNLCYKPLAGIGKTVQAVEGGAICVNCNIITSAAYIIDASRNNYATVGNLATVAAGTGLSVIDTLLSYPAGWHAGYEIDFGNDVVTADLLSFFSIQTFNQGVFQESRNTSNGLRASLLSGSSGKVYLNFPTTQAFNEVRFVVSSAVTALSTLRVYYAMAFDPNCGTIDNNAVCYDQIAGSSTSVNFNGGSVSALASLGNAANTVDGNKASFSTLTLPAGVSLLGMPPFVGVKDDERIYPAGTRAGFVINSGSSLLSAGVLSALSVQTYLHGQLQDNVPYPGGLLQVSGLGAGNALQEVSIATAKPYNEVRLVVAQAANVNVGTLNICYAFESGGACALNCNAPLINTTAAPAAYSLVTRDRNPGLATYTTTGTYGLVSVGSLTGTANVLNGSLTDYATFSAVLGLAGGARITVQSSSGADYPANTFAGFAISAGSGLLDVGLLDAITLRLYNNDGTNPVQTISGASLLNLGLLGGGAINYVGGKATVPFDEMEIDINAGLLSAAADFHIYYPYVVRDDDNDGVSDCIEVCGTAGNDAIDTDGDGIPDGCDACSIVGVKSSVIDTDNDGVVNSCDADSDNDGIADAVEDRNGDGDPSNDDADGDGVPNYLDLDSDNDGINDIRESGISKTVIALLDTDNDGKIDAAIAKGNNGMANLTETNDTPVASINYILSSTDLASVPAGDNAPDFLDLDSDNDGLNDLVESGQTGIQDLNGDGMADGPDSDGDGIMDSADGDDALFGDAGDPVLRNTDNDAVDNYRDLDCDNDGIFDSREGYLLLSADADVNGTVDGVDSDGDGIIDAADGYPGSFGDAGDRGGPDTEGDGIFDAIDLDSDNDGIFDTNERLNKDLDADNDGMVDGVDTDGDGIVNVPELDNNNSFGGSAAAVLPVRLISFDAGKQGRSVLLQWKVGDEKAFKQYDIERSADAKNYQILGTVAGTQKLAYAFTDRTPGGEINYYRLKMIDLDGSFSYSAVKMIKIDANAGSTPVISPNPVHDHYYLQFGKSQTGLFKVEVRNMQGQVFFSRNLTLQNQSRIDLVRPVSATAGIYQLIIVDLSTNKRQVSELLFK